MAEETQTKERSVDYGAVTFDELPPAPVRKGGGGAESVFDKLLDDVHNDPKKKNKPVSIGRYKNETAAKAAKNVLQQRNGRTQQVTGHEFHVRPRIEDSEGAAVPEGTDGSKEVWHLFVIYDPKKIVDGALDEHKRKEAERIAKIEEKRKEREEVAAKETAEKAAKEAGGGTPAPSA